MRDEDPLARQKRIGHDQHSIGTHVAQRQERSVEAAPIRRLKEIELQIQRRCPAPRLPDGDDTIRVARVGQHGDAGRTFAADATATDGDTIKLDGTSYKFDGIDGPPNASRAC